MTASRDVDTEAEEIIAAISVWADETMAKLGESPEALRGCLTLCDAIISLVNAVRESTPEHIRMQSQFVGTIALVAAVTDHLHELGL